MVDPKALKILARLLTPEGKFIPDFEGVPVSDRAGNLA